MMIKGRNAILSGEPPPAVLERAMRMLVAELASAEGIDESQIFSGFEAMELQVADEDETITVTKVWAELLSD